MSDLGALSIGLVLGLAVVAAVLLRDEEEVRRAWRRRRGIVEPDEPIAAASPKTPPIRGWHIAWQAVLVILLVRYAVSDHDAFSIAVAALAIPAFGITLFKYRRSRIST